MRVLHLTAGNLFGGVETFLLTLAAERSLCPEMEPEFGICFEGQLSAELRAAGVKVHELGNVRFSRPWTVWLARRRLERLLSKSPPDAVVTHACWPHSVFAPVVRKSKVPVTFCGHDFPNPHHWLDKKAARTPPVQVIANSRYTAAGMAKLFPGAPVTAIYYPVRTRPGDDSHRESIRSELRTPKDKVVILCCCRLEKWKGHPSLLKALGALRGNPRWTCWIAGGVQRPHEQEYLDHLHQMEKELGLVDRIRWLGQRRDVPDLLAAADIHCQPNLAPEPFGIVFVEALIASRPVIAIRQGGAAEIVDESCGILVEPNQTDALAQALGQLIDRPEFRLRLGERGPARARLLCDPAKQMREIWRQLNTTDGSAS